MRRIRLAVRTTFHPDAGGTRRFGEVFDVSDDLGEHWVKGAIAHDAAGEDLTEPVAPLMPDSAGYWPTPESDAASLEGAVVNGNSSQLSSAMQESPSILGEIGPMKQRRGRR